MARNTKQEPTVIEKINEHLDAILDTEGGEDILESFLAILEGNGSQYQVADLVLIGLKEDDGEGEEGDEPEEAPRGRRGGGRKQEPEEEAEEEAPRGRRGRRAEPEEEAEEEAPRGRRGSSRRAEPEEDEPAPRRGAAPAARRRR